MQESDDSVPCYVMRFVNGKTLAQCVHGFLENERIELSSGFSQSVELRQLLRALVTVCNIVAYAHAQGVIHRDIKPGNIILGPFGEILLLDWGIAKHVQSGSAAVPQANDSSLVQTTRVDFQQLRTISNLNSPTYTATGQAIGTPAYASPEQMQGLDTASKPSTDLFSLGATLHFVLCGKAPIEIFGWSDYLNCCNTSGSPLASKLPPQVPKALQAICNKAMQTKPEDRYPNALMLAADIENFLSQESVSVFRDPWYAKVTRAARKRPGIAGALMAASAVVLIATIISSAIVDGKNRKLLQTTDSLNRSLEKTQLANQQVLTTLRKMSHGAVLDKFSRLEELTEIERDYLQQMLAQYNAFSELLGDDIASRSVQAEANYRSALLLYWLSQNQAAIPKAKLAVAIYQDLCLENAQVKLVEDYLESIRLLSSMLVVTQQADSGIDLARSGLSKIELLRNEYPDLDPGALSSKQTSLLSNIATGYVQKRDWKQAFAVSQEALSLHRERASDQAGQGQQHGLASVLCRLAELAVHPEVECDVEMQLSFANECVQLRQQMLEAEPTIAEAQSNYAQALYSRALAHQRAGNNAVGHQDIDTAITYQDRLRERYSLRLDYNHAVVRYRLLKVRFLHDDGNWQETMHQIAKLRELQLTVEALTICIDRLTEYWRLFPQYPLTLDWLAEMYTRRANLLDSDSPKQTLSDRQLAVETTNQLVQEEPNSVAHQAALIRAIIALYKDQRRFDKTAEVKKLLEQIDSLLKELKESEASLYETLQLEVDDAKQAPEN